MYVKCLQRWKNISLEYNNFTLPPILETYNFIILLSRFILETHKDWLGAYSVIKIPTR